MRDPLREAVRRSHRALNKQLQESADSIHGQAACGEVVQKTDAFLIDVSRHVSAVCDVVLPATRIHVPNSRDRIKEYVRAARGLERAVAQSKGRLYGASNAIHLPWARVSSELRAHFAVLLILESALILELSKASGSKTSSGLARRLKDVELTSPTRPHPNSPHTGRLAHVTRRLWMHADAFWDTVEARIVTRAAEPARKVTVRLG